MEDDAGARTTGSAQNEKQLIEAARVAREKREKERAAQEKAAERERAARTSTS